MKLISKSLILALPVDFSLSSPGAMVTVGSVAIAATLSGCSSPAQRQQVRQDTRIVNRTEDQYERRRD